MSYEPIGYLGFGIELGQEAASELRDRKLKKLKVSCAGDYRAGGLTYFLVLASTLSSGDSFTATKLNSRKCKMLREGLPELREMFRDAMKTADINDELLIELLAEQPTWIMWSAIV